MVAQLVEDLLHLERRQDRLDQDRRPDRPARDPERVLREGEDVVPEPRLQVVLQLRQVEVRPRAPRQQLARVVEEVQSEVEEARRDRLAVHLHVLLRQVPPARPHDQRRDLVGESVLLPLRTRVLQRATHRILEVRLPLDHVAPRRRERVLEIRHEDPRPRIQRVDHHLALDRARDLHPPVLQVRRRRRHRPLRAPHLLRLRQEARTFTRVQRRLPRRPPLQQLPPPRAEPPLQRDDERQRIGCQHPPRRLAPFRRQPHAFHRDLGHGLSLR